MLRKNGDSFPGEIKGSLLRGTNGRPKGFIAIARDISERKALEKQAGDLLEQVQNLARRDSLTQLNNHRYFYELGEAEFTRSKRYNHPLAAIMIDLDHFKQVNDTYGHQVGDQVLRHAAEHLQANLREVDILGRIGGEEFLALLPETTPQEARIIAKRLRMAIETTPFSLEIYRANITASLGVSVSSNDCISLGFLVHQADQALYRAKRNGRNRVEIWDRTNENPPRSSSDDGNLT